MTEPAFFFFFRSTLLCILRADLGWVYIAYKYPREQAGLLTALLILILTQFGLLSISSGWPGRA
jgi:hypothetical protein